ncbi:MAG: hypothetical protein R2728_05590 [Chitinophagales bacterium]
MIQFLTSITSLNTTYTLTVNVSDCDLANVGTVIDTFSSVLGCDSIVTTITSLLPSSSNTINLTSCDPADVGN